MVKIQCAVVGPLSILLHFTDGNQKGKNVFCGAIIYSVKTCCPTFCQLYNSVCAHKPTLKVEGPFMIICVFVTRRLMETLAWQNLSVISRLE